MSKHTPGPWYFLPDRNGRLQVGPSINYTVAAMWVTPLEGQEANARLISAAPELLEALEKCRKELSAWMQCYCEDAATQEAISQARAAIAKATGEKA